MVKDSKKTGMLVKQDAYLESGIHIGTKIKTHDMNKFIFKRRDDGLYILDLKRINERLADAAKLIARYDPKDVLIVASRIYSGNTAKKFAKLTGVHVQTSRFIPGTMTNTQSEYFTEPKLLFISDPRGEHSAVMGAARVNVPVIALCDTENITAFVDLVIPANNKGRKSLALIFYILAREVMMAQEKIKSYDEFPYDIRYFEKMDDE